MFKNVTYIDVMCYCYSEHLWCFGGNQRLPLLTENIQENCFFIFFGFFCDYSGTRWPVSLSFIAWNMQYAICNMQYAICNMQYAICNMQYVICNMQYAICNIQYAICNMQYAICNMEYASDLKMSVEKLHSYPALLALFAVLGSKWVVSQYVCTISSLNSASVRSLL